MITVFRSTGEGCAPSTLTAQELLAQAEALRAGPTPVFWLDLADPTPEEEAAVFQHFHYVHALTFEDVTRPRREPDSPPHFPKAEEFPDYLFVVVNPLRGEVLQSIAKAEIGQELSEDGLFSQLSTVLTETLLITHHYEPLAAIDQLRIFLEKHQLQVERGPDYLFHLILDATVDQYAPALDHLEDQLDAIEVAVFSHPNHSLLARLLQLKRDIVLMRKGMIYEREVLARLCRGEFHLIDDREMAYYRNVYDHLVRFSELIESSREMVADLMQTHLAASSHKLNEIMKVLTMISTIVLPMTLIAGIYGMNFVVLPEKDWEFGYPFSLALMFLTGSSAVFFFRWRRWL